MQNIIQKWPSGMIFVLASIGAAAGLGNLWRFPYLAYENGGAAFVLAMILINLIIGIPLFIGETAVGQMAEAGPHRAFGILSKKLRNMNFLGWMPIIACGVVLSYYIVVMAWSVYYLFLSFNLGWGADTETFFLNKVLQISSGAGEIGSISLVLLIPLLIAWAATYFCIRKGVASISKVVIWTATLPFLTLLILLIRAVTLPGAMDGLELFLIPDFSLLLEAELWVAAVSQTFFSLGVGFGIAYLYAKYNKRSFNVVKGSVAIAIGNFLVSLLSGFVVFGVLGYMALQQGVAVTEVVSSGPILAFVTIPLALSLLPALQELFSVIFFASVAMLAVDSAFAMLEVVVSGVTSIFSRLSHHRATVYAGAVIAVCSLLFTTGGGLYYLDIVDHFLTQYVILGFAIVQSVVFGWFLVGENSIKTFIDDRTPHIDIGSIWRALMRYLIPVVLVIFFIWGLIGEFTSPYEGYPIWALLSLGVGVIVGIVLAALLLESFVRYRNRSSEQ